MADIAVPSFVNYTDLRKKTELPQIEVEQIKNYARSLNDEQMRIFLSVVPYSTLTEECSRKYYELEVRDKSMKRIMGM